MLSCAMDTSLWSDWGLESPCWAESKGGERAQIPEVGMAQLSGLVIGGSNALWVEVLRDRDVQRELYGEVGGTGDEGYDAYLIDTYLCSVKTGVW